MQAQIAQQKMINQPRELRKRTSEIREKNEVKEVVGQKKEEKEERKLTIRVSNSDHGKIRLKILPLKRKTEEKN